MAIFLISENGVSLLPLEAKMVYKNSLTNSVDIAQIKSKYYVTGIKSSESLSYRL